jgi:hypothetical protein
VPRVFAERWRVSKLGADRLAVRDRQEDIGGVTLRRVVEGMTGLTSTQLGDGSTVYGGTVPAGQIARETGFKEGRLIRVPRSATSPTPRRPTLPRPSLPRSPSGQTASSGRSR